MQKRGSEYLFLIKNSWGIAKHNSGHFWITSDVLLSCFNYARQSFFDVLLPQKILGADQSTEPVRYGAQELDPAQELDRLGEELGVNMRNSQTKANFEWGYNIPFTNGSIILARHSLGSVVDEEKNKKNPKFFRR